MKNKIELKLTLNNVTPELFKRWKSCEQEINQIAEDKGSIIRNIEYNDETYTKSCHHYYDSEEEIFKVLLSIDQYLANKKMFVKLLSRKLLDCDSHTLINEYRTNFPRREYA